MISQGYLLIIGLSLLILYQGLGEKAVDQSLTNNTEAAQQLGANLGQWIVSSVNNNLANNNTITLQLKYSGGDTTYLASYNNIITDLTLELIQDNESELNIRIKDSKNYRFTLPYNAPFAYTKSRARVGVNLYKYELPSVGQPFKIKVSRASTGEVIFDTSAFQFVYSNQYLEVSTAITNDLVYGLGERRMKTFQYLSGNYSFWNQDQYMHWEDGQPDGQTYGYHSVYLRKDTLTTNWHAVLLRSVNGLLIQYVSNQRLTYKLIGGIIEFQFFLGDSQPETTIKLYHNYINGWAMHPFWAMGFHQCRWGYNTSESMVTVVNKFSQYDLPMDVIWSDIDYMVDYYDFSVDTTRYNLLDMKNMMNRETSEGVHWVPIIDAGVAIPTAGAVRGAQMDVFIKSSQFQGQNLVGCVWPGKTFFTDFNHPKAQQFWTEGLQNITDIYGLTPSGFWIDMNQYSNFMVGEINIASPCPPMSAGPQETEKDFLTKEKSTQLGGVNYPFNPTAPNPLDHKTLSLDGYHYSGEGATFIKTPDGSKIYELDYHNLNGFSETVATNNALKSMGHQLPFIITRSSIFGSGAYAQHWTGDNGASWEFLASSLNEIFNFQLFGIPLTGVDICGFAGNTWPELCARWMQVGLFYPFSRNHNSNDTISQQPYAFPSFPYVLDSSRSSIKLRYRLLKYYYHLFVRSRGQGTIFKPLFFQFPEDANTYTLSSEFMLGDALLFTPVLKAGDAIKNTTTINIYVPAKNTFFDFSTGVIAASGYSQLTVPFNSTVPMFIREGQIVHVQNIQGVKRSRQLTNHFTLNIALNQTQISAAGTIMSITEYTDDDIIQKCSGSSNDCLINILADGTQIGDQIYLDLLFQGSTTQTQYETIYIDAVNLYGVQDFMGRPVNQIVSYTFPAPIQVSGDNVKASAQIAL